MPMCRVCSARTSCPRREACPALCLAKRGEGAVTVAPQKITSARQKVEPAHAVAEKAPDRATLLVVGLIQHPSVDIQVVRLEVVDIGAAHLLHVRHVLLLAAALANVAQVRITAPSAAVLDHLRAVLNIGHGGGSANPQCGSTSSSSACCS